MGADKGGRRIWGAGVTRLPKNLSRHVIGIDRMCRLSRLHGSTSMGSSMCRLPRCDEVPTLSFGRSKAGPTVSEEMIQMLKQEQIGEDRILLGGMTQ